jgi:FtsP/CotA-like multicopper oxidase with cupredoxin domain
MPWQPGQSYTYRFLATVPGTYWYYAHQNQMVEVDGGLFGALVVAPAAPSAQDDVDATVVLHEWRVGRRLAVAMNGTICALRIPARPGTWVRVQLINMAAPTILHDQGQGLTRHRPDHGVYRRAGANPLRQ